MRIGETHNIEWQVVLFQGCDIRFIYFVFFVYFACSVDSDAFSGLPSLLPGYSREVIVP